MYDVFISYSRKDKEIVSKFYDAFIKAGLTVWMDVNGIETGDAFKERIVDAISNSELFLFFSSQSSNNSPWTIKEVGVANSFEKPIIPIKLDNSKYHKSVLFDLVNISYIDYTVLSQQETSLLTLIKDIKNRVTRKGADEFLYCPSCHSNHLMIKLQNADMEKKREEVIAAMGGASAIAASLLFSPIALAGFGLTKKVKDFFSKDKEEAQKQFNIVFTCSECGNVFDLSTAGISHKK